MIKINLKGKNEHQQLFSSPSGSLQYQRDVVQSGLIYNVPESSDSNTALTDIFVAIEVAA